MPVLRLCSRRRPPLPGLLLAQLLLLPLCRAAALQENFPDVVKGPFSSCPCSPSGRGTARGAQELLADAVADVTRILRNNDHGSALTEVQVSALADAHLVECRRIYGAESCINADAQLRPQGLCTYDGVTGRNLKFDGLSRTYSPLSPCDTLPNFDSSSRNRRVHAAPVVEGCVDAALLHGAALQHRRHLWRAVLCVGELCATPNHALVVEGEITSMRRLCERRWKCVRSWRWVNNLKVAKNRRWPVQDMPNVFITPYDLRFPKVAVWVVQVVQDVVDIVVLSCALGGLLSVAILMRSRL